MYPCAIWTCNIYIYISPNDRLTEPIDGRWAFWGAWSQCSKTCDKGIQHRTRQCSQPAPANGGNDCHGNNRQEKDCAEFPCPCTNTLILFFIMTIDNKTSKYVRML